MKRSTLILFLFLLLILLTAGCASSKSSAILESPAPQFIEKNVVATVAVERSAAEVPSDMGIATSTEQLLEDRKIIYNANMFLIVEDTEAAAQQIADLATNLGGYVASMKGYRQGERMLYDITIRVPADRFETGRAALRRLAVRVESENISTNDVTDQYYDLDARLRTLKDTEEELRQLLKDTRERGGKVEDIMKIYDRLIEIRSQIESLQGQLNRLDKLVSYATFTIHLEPHVLSEPIQEEGWHPAEIVHQSFKKLVSILTGLATLTIQFIIVVVPVLIILLLPVLLLLAILKAWQKRRNKHATPPAPRDENA